MDNFTVPQPHFLIVTFPAQGHINPGLELAKRLARTGSRVTFAASVSAYRRMINTGGPVPDGLSLATFSDGFDDGYKTSSSSDDNNKNDPDRYLSEMRRRGRETLIEVIEDNQNQGRPFTCVVYTPLLSWVSKVAREFQLPSALLWVQPATVFDIYYYYYYGYGDVIIRTANNNPSSSIKLPRLPPLNLRDLPSFIIPSNSYAFLLPAFQEQLQSVKEETKPTILVNTFDELEPEALNSIPDFKMVAVGPLINPRNDSSDVGQCRDPENYIDWLETKPDSSVIYISFGTMAVLSKKQLEELARELIQSRRPFLWVITNKPHRSEEEGEKEEDCIASFRQELDELGMILSWCDQIRVLRHRSVGCFVTHCGWNSALESLVLGVPVVAFPQWADQMTNAKLLEECWRTGVRVKENEEGVVESEEIRRCIEAVMEEETAEFRKNAAKWRDLAAEVVQEGGSSSNNLKAFADEHTGSLFGSN